MEIPTDPPLRVQGISTEIQWGCNAHAERANAVKRALGAWMAPVLSLLAKGKTFRQSPLNPFAYHAEARMHRELRGWFQNMIDDIIAYPTLVSTETLEQILKAPMEIRGYGPVREDAAIKVKAKVEMLRKH